MESEYGRSLKEMVANMLGAVLRCGQRASEVGFRYFLWTNVRIQQMISDIALVRAKLTSPLCS